jgi:hypothetical protein
MPPKGAKNIAKMVLKTLPKGADAFCQWIKRSFTLTCCKKSSFSALEVIL